MWGAGSCAASRRSTANYRWQHGIAECKW
jgi:hypothetical protein